MIGAGALLFGVACEVPEVRIWATLALPASLVISTLYVVLRRWRSQPPTTLHLDESRDTDRVAGKSQDATNRHSARNLCAPASLW